MSVQYISGNAQNRVNAGTVTASSADADFPITNVQNGRPWEVFRFNAAASGDWIRCDLGSALAVTWCSIHFHNVDSGITSIAVQSDTTSAFSTPTARGTLVDFKPATFLTFTASPNEQWWRVLFNGTNGDPIYVGEWILGAHSTLSRNQKYGWNVGYKMPTLRTQPSGAQLRTTLGRADSAPRSLNMDWEHRPASDRDEVKTLIEDSAWGEEPVVINPDSGQNLVMHGRVTDAWGFEVGEAQTDYYAYGLQVQEDGGPVVMK